MPETPTVLGVLLDNRGLARYGSFAAAYRKTARSLDPSLSDEAPSRAQFYRWTKGGQKGFPTPSTAASWSTC